MPNIALAIHGGAGTILRSNMSPEKEAAYRAGLAEALDVGWKLLGDGASALDVVEMSVRALEDIPLFNAGKGCVYTGDETHEMDAAIMWGDGRLAGSVAGVTCVRNPITLARRIMERSEYVMLSGRGAEEFAREMNLEIEEPDYFHHENRYQQLLEARRGSRVQLDHSDREKPEPDDKKFGTVGAVALDANGNLAAATSTGGMTNKRYGRIGDSPIIGAGTYADNDTCAISCTGHGEYFIRAVVAHEVAALMRHAGASLQAASDVVVYETLQRMGGEGGLIGVDREGNIVMPFNTEGMYRAAVSSTMERVVEIYRM